VTVAVDSDDRLLSQWQPRLPELEALAGPLLRSAAVQRLRNVTFLGILSPRFHRLPGCPLWPAHAASLPDDGSRLDHSVGVALTALEVARRLGLSSDAQRYAVAWGLTHDIATWPLAHTSEPAFEAITGTTPRTLRTAMVLGRAEAPEPYRLAPALREMGVDPEALARLFDRGPAAVESELALFMQVIRSPLTPDTLEGTWRCGVVFGVPVPPPQEVLLALVRRDRTASLGRQHLRAVLEFWRRKAEVYRNYINREDVALWESAWSLALQREFVGISLDRSLDIPEEALVERVRRTGVPPTRRVVRYKEPQEYYVNGALDALPPEPPVSELWRVLRREPAGSLNG
jgi:hypothetical protein